MIQGNILELDIQIGDLFPRPGAVIKVEHRTFANSEFSHGQALERKTFNWSFGRSLRFGLGRTFFRRFSETLPVCATVLVLFQGDFRALDHKPLHFNVFRQQGKELHPHVKRLHIEEVFLLEARRRAQVKV